MRCGTITGDYDTGLATDITLPVADAIANGQELGAIVRVNGLPYKVTAITDTVEGKRKCDLRPARELPEWVEAVDRHV